MLFFLQIEKRVKVELDRPTSYSSRSRENPSRNGRENSLDSIKSRSSSEEIAKLINQNTIPLKEWAPRSIQNRFIGNGTPSSVNRISAGFGVAGVAGVAGTPGGNLPSVTNATNATNATNGHPTPSLLPRNPVRPQPPDTKYTLNHPYYRFQNILVSMCKPPQLVCNENNQIVVMRSPIPPSPQSLIFCCKTSSYNSPFQMCDRT